MAIGGTMNTKQKICMYAGAAFFVIAIFCAVEFWTIGNDAYRFGALGGLILGIVHFAFIWSTGLAKSTDPDNDEWMNTIR